jgi:hypothetical protein
MPIKYWEIIADSLSKAGWSLGVSAIHRESRTIWIVDAHRDDGKRFVARSDEKLTAFLDLERATRLIQGRCAKRRSGTNGLKIKSVDEPNEQYPS